MRSGIRAIAGAQRLTYLDIVNNEQDFFGVLQAEPEIQGFRNGQGGQSFTRGASWAPRRRDAWSWVTLHDQPADKASMIVSCNAVLETGGERRRGQMPRSWKGHHRRAAVLSASAKNAGIEGDAVVRYCTARRQCPRRDAEIVRSSGYPALDDVAIDTIRSGKFTKECDATASQACASFAAGLTPIFNHVPCRRLRTGDGSPNTGNLIRLAANTGCRISSSRLIPPDRNRGAPRRPRP